MRNQMNKRHERNGVGTRIDLLVQNTPRYWIKVLPARRTDSETSEFAIIWYIFMQHILFTIETFTRWFNKPPLPKCRHELCDHFMLLSKNTFTIVMYSRKLDFAGTPPSRFTTIIDWFLCNPRIALLWWIHRTCLLLNITVFVEMKQHIQLMSQRQMVSVNRAFSVIFNVNSIDILIHLWINE